VVNEALRAGLARARDSSAGTPYRLEPARLGELAAGVDPTRMLNLADQLHDEEVAHELRARK
jgi:hypothetical protein